RERAARTAVHRLVPHGPRPPACSPAVPVRILRQPQDRLLRLPEVRPRARRDKRMATVLPRWRRRPSRQRDRPGRTVVGPAREVPVTPAPKLRTGTRGRRPAVRQPHPTVRYVQEQLGISQPGATSMLRRLAEQGILREEGTGAGVRHRWFSDEILGVLD